MIGSSVLRMDVVLAGLLLLGGITSLATVSAAEPPLPLATGQRMLIIKLPDGRLMGGLTRTVEGVQEEAARYSEDNGLTWSEPQTLFKLATGGGKWLSGYPFVDSDGEVHFFFMRYAKAGEVAPAVGQRLPEAAPFGTQQALLKLVSGAGKWLSGYPLLNRDNDAHFFFMRYAKAVKVAPGETEEVLEGAHLGGYGGNRLDLWHTKSTNGRQDWPAPRMIWKGYTGAINSEIQMTNGRIILPFGQYTGGRVGSGAAGLRAFRHTGGFQSTAVYSDDAGETWHLSPSSLSVGIPIYAHGYGADEPVILQLQDGRVWMLIRTQVGHFWESFSDDGATWSSPQPTTIINSDSPAGLVRLDDGRLVLFWNCCQRFPYAYGGRHVLHAAISDDDGKTWRGYREVARDPKRNEPPPVSTHDFGTAYPFPTVANDGKVIYCTGQGEGRVLLMLLDPEWLLETHQRCDFSEGAEEDWQTFGTRGADIVAHPDNPQSRVLSMRKPDADWPAAAVWNFPAGLEGSLQMRVMLNEGFAGVRIGLTDHFSTPFDREAQIFNLYNIEIGPDGKLPNGRKLTLGQWHDLQLDWSTRRGVCRVTLDDQRAGTVLLRPKLAF